MAIFLGVDVGTSGLKAIAIDGDRGQVLASATRDYPLETPRPGWAEQDAEDFAAAAIEALRELGGALGPRAKDVRAIGLTGQMHSAVLLDADGAPVRPAILWCDVRTADECRQIHARLGDHGLARTVGNKALEGFTLPKLLWVRAHEPEAFARVRRVLMPKDFVGLRLSGVCATDVSDASGTLAFDPAARRFSQEVLEAFELPASLFPPSGESVEPLGEILPEVARITGLPETTVVVRGAADNAAGAVGLGVVSPGRGMVSLGTSGVVLAHTDRYAVDPALRLHAFCHAVPGKHYAMGVMLAAGGALRWYRDVLCDGERMAAELTRQDPYEVICDAASTARLGAGGVLFLPYLMGERTPHADATARAAFVGMTARTTKADLSRAVLEGITHGLSDALDLLHDAYGPLRELRITGGGAKSPFWRQMIADALGVPVATTTSTEGPAYGAAILAAVAVGTFLRVEEACDALVHVTRRVDPDPVAHARYREAHAVHRGLYVDLRERFRALAALEG